MNKDAFKYIKPQNYRRFFEFPKEKLPEAWLRTPVFKRIMNVVKPIEEQKRKIAPQGQALSASDWTKKYKDTVKKVFNNTNVQPVSVNFKTPKGKSTGFVSETFRDLPRDQRRALIGKHMIRDKHPAVSKSKIVRTVMNSGSGKTTSKGDYIKKEIKQDPLRFAGEAATIVGGGTIATNYARKKMKKEGSAGKFINRAKELVTGSKMRALEKTFYDSVEATNKAMKRRSRDVFSKSDETMANLNPESMQEFKQFGKKTIKNNEKDIKGIKEIGNELTTESRKVMGTWVGMGGVGGYGAYKGIEKLKKKEKTAAIVPKIVGRLRDGSNLANDTVMGGVFPSGDGKSKILKAFTKGIKSEHAIKNWEHQLNLLGKRSGRVEKGFLNNRRFLKDVEHTKLSSAYDYFTGAAGVLTGYDMGRDAAEAVAGSLSQYGDKTKNQQFAKAVASVFSPLGALAGWALLNRYKPKVTNTIFKLLKDNDTTAFAMHAAPFLAATSGGVTAGAGTGALVSLRKSKFGKEKKERLDEEYFNKLMSK